MAFPAPTHRPPRTLGRPWRATWTRAAALLIALAVLGVLPSCLSRKALQKEQFTLTGAGSDIPSGNVRTSLNLTASRVSPPYDSRNLLYRIGESSFESDPYALWMAPPGALATRALRTRILASGVVRDVSLDGPAPEPAIRAEIEWTQFHGDFRNTELPTAEAALTLRILGPQGLNQGQATARVHRYHASIPLSKRSASAVVAGLESAIAAIASQLKPDLSGYIQDLPAASSPASPTPNVSLTP